MLLVKSTTKICRKVVVFVKSFFSDKANIAPVSVLLIAAVLRFYKLGEQSLWYDEIVTVVRAQQGLRYIFSLPNPLIYFLVYIELLFGDLGFIIRFYTAIFGILSVAALYVLAKRLFDKRTALLSSLFLALNTYHIFHSQEARFYTLVTFFSLLTVYFLARAVKEQSFKLWLAFVASVFLSIFTHQTALLFILAEAVFLGGYVIWHSISLRWLPGLFGINMVGLKARANRRTVFLTTLGLLTSLPLLVRFFSISTSFISEIFLRDESQIIRPYPDNFEMSMEFVEDLFNTYWAGYYSDISDTTLHVLGFFFLIGFLSLLKRKKTFLALVCCWFLLPVFYIAAIRPSHFFNPRYFIFYLPIWLLLIARGIVICSDVIRQSVLEISAPCPIRPRVWFIVPSLFLSFYAYILPSIPCTMDYYSVWWKMDWRGMAEFFEDYYKGGDIIYSWELDGLISIPYYLLKEAGRSIVGLPGIRPRLEDENLAELGICEFTVLGKYRSIFSRSCLVDALTDYSGTLWFVSSVQQPPVDIENGVIVEEFSFGDRDVRWVYKVEIVPKLSG